MENGNNIKLNRTSLGSFWACCFVISEFCWARTTGRIKFYFSHNGKIPNSCSKFSSLWNEIFAGKKCQMDVTEKCYTIVLLIHRYRTLIFFSTFCCIRKSLNNNNSGNFIFVFECTIIIVNLATYRQFTNAAWDRIIKTKRKEKKIKNALSLGYPNSYFYNKRCNMLL